ncbi:lytic transglycosylase domain-containing protein [Seohaeicola saemankumensis]|uniref:Lytic transglycosylase domain-containing protein n=1 Tax=Seohaeicola saemankumensis TaxID=481181 RepID=A0ABW3TG37_9RHOB
MLRKAILTAALAGFVMTSDGVAQQTGPQPLASAMAAVRSGNWDNAATLAERAGPEAVTLVEWHRLRAGRGTPDQVLSFLERNADWPGLALLRRRSEQAFVTATDAQVMQFFRDQPPQTGTGVLRHAAALKEAGRAGDAEAGLVLAWRTLALDRLEHEVFVGLHGPLLAPHHAARLDMTLWRGLTEDAERMLPLVGADRQALARARLALKAQADGVNALIDAVPAALKADPGLAHDRFNWRIQKGLTDGAIALLLERSDSAAGLGEPQRWAGWRGYLARAQMREGKTDLAYRLAASHQLTEGSDYADLEWLAGYIALIYMKETDLALDHFQRFRAAVSTPISLGRAGYWIGRAQEAAGDPEAAGLAYADGAQHQTSFYGLLAAEKAGAASDPSLKGADAPSDWRQAAFTTSSVYRAGLLLLRAGETGLAEQFFTHLAEGQDATGLAQLGEMAIDLGEPHLAVMIGKEAANQGVTLPRPYYALHPMRDMRLPVPMELAKSIARRESEFDPAVVSGAGAQGLMQLMPGTAAEVARDLGLDHDAGRVLSDWSYNARLGSGYLARLGADFGGNVVLVAAAYNAGPSRPIRWMQEQGDPRGMSADQVVDWIEHIPFRETRNYVMRVAESLPIYRARLGLDPHPVPFSRELSGATVLPLAP